MEGFRAKIDLIANIHFNVGNETVELRIRVDASCSYLHGESPPGNVDDRAAVEVVGELAAVHRGAHEDQLQVRSSHDDVFQDG